MSDNKTAAPTTTQLAEKVVGLFDDYNLTAAEIVASLEVAKSVVLMDCVAHLIAATQSHDFIKDMIADYKLYATDGPANPDTKTTVN